MSDDLHPDETDTDTPHRDDTVSDAPAPEPPRAAGGNGHDLRAKVVAELPAMDVLDAALVIKARAAELDVDLPALKRAVEAARNATQQQAKAQAKALADAIKAQEKTAADAAKAQAKTDADAAKAAARAQAKAEAEARKQEQAEIAAGKKAEAEAKAQEKAARAQDRAATKAAKEKERAAKRADAEKKRKARPRLRAEQDDGLGGWTPPLPPLPEILVEGGERPAISDAGLAAMVAARVPFYQRGKDLVRVCLTKMKLSTGEAVRVPAISILTKPVLLRALGQCAKWLGFNKYLDLVQIDPPGDLADHILGMVNEWPFPPLRGVIATQTMRYDGTLLTEPGYDERTGLVLFNPPTLPTMRRNPTKADALEALALLNDLLTGFEFANDDGVSRSGAISMLMTPVLRGMMPAVPIHFITKPDAGSGGSYMQDLMSAIAIGERCPTISLTLHNNEENEKRLSAVAVGNQPIIAIDNFTGTLMGNFFCQLIERTMPQVRILGKTEMVTIPNNHTVVANGINITIGTDAVRRGVQISLDPNVENPFERTFTRDPVAEVLANRGPAVAAILTIARAYRVAGTPGRLAPRNSFEVWSDNVRSALVWLGWPDCDLSIKEARAADPHTSKLAAVIDAWAKELTVGLGYFTSELVKEATAIVYASDGSGSQHNKPDLWDALFEVAGNRNGQLDGVRLGLWLQDHLNQISGGYKLLVDRTNKAKPRWSLEPR